MDGARPIFPRPGFLKSRLCKCRRHSRLLPAATARLVGASSRLTRRVTVAFATPVFFAFTKRGPPVAPESFHLMNSAGLGIACLASERVGRRECEDFL